MILNRLGNKKKLAPLICNLFPDHTIYIEPFFGAGGMFFYKKPRAKFNILNDIDDDVINLFDVARKYPDRLRQAIQMMPIHQTLLTRWLHEEETSPVWKAVRFLMISNFTFRGRTSKTLRYGANDLKASLLAKYNTMLDILTSTGIQFNCTDYRTFIKAIAMDDNQRKNAFIYADPPYINTRTNYDMKDFSWQKANCAEVLDTLIGTGLRFAMSEYDNQDVKDLALERGLHYHQLKTRMGISMCESTEVLVTNYLTNDTLF